MSIRCTRIERTLLDLNTSPDELDELAIHTLALAGATMSLHDPIFTGFREESHLDARQSPHLPGIVQTACQIKVLDACPLQIDRLQC